MKDRKMLPVSELESMDIFDESISQPKQEVDERGIIELVHDGYLGPGFRTMHEAWAAIRKPGTRLVTHGEDGQWYCLAAGNARKYNKAVDERKGEANEYRKRSKC